MRYIVIISPLATFDIDFVSNVVSQVSRASDNEDDCGRFAVLLSDDQLDKCVSVKKSARSDVWYDGATITEETDSFLNTSKSIGFTHNICDELFRLADHLPYTGCIVDVILHVPPVDPTSKCYTALCGALRCLTDWHNAHIIIVCRDTTNSDCVNPLQTFLRATVFQNPTEVVLQNALWRGKVAIVDKIENKGFIFPGFMLGRNEEEEFTANLKFPSKHFFRHREKDANQKKENGAVLGRMFEFLDEVSLSSVPSFMFTSNRFRLNLQKGHVQSEILCDHIRENTESAILVRLPCYRPASPIPTCGNKILTSTAWREAIVMDVSFWQEPEEEHLPGYDFLYFMFVADDNSNHNSISVLLLNSPQQMNGAMFQHLYMQSLVPFSEGGAEEVGHLLLDLPDLSEEMFLHLTSDLCRVQSRCLSAIIEERRKQGLGAEMTVAELYSVLWDIQQFYLEEVGKVCPRHELATISSGHLQQPLSELDTNPANWPERLQLVLVESQKKSLSRLQSTDSMPVSSPIQPDQGNSVVDVQDFLKFFLPDGSAAADSLSPIRRQRNISVSRISRQTEEDLSTVRWPNAIDVKFHGVHYNKDRKSERHEQHYSKLRDKYVKDETFSWCSKPGFAIPKVTNKAKMSAPLRRSPRKRVTRQLQDTEPKLVSFSDRRASLKSAKVLRCTENDLPSTSSRCHSATTVLPSPPRSKSHKTSKTQHSPVGSHTEPIQPTAVKTDNQSFDASQKQTVDSKAKEKKESRSQRHKRRLESIVEAVLKKNGVDRTSTIYTACSSKLFRVTKIFVMDLPTSENLKDEMRKIAEGQVDQVIELEKRRRSSSGKCQK